MDVPLNFLIYKGSLYGFHNVSSLEICKSFHLRITHNLRGVKFEEAKQANDKLVKVHF